MGKEAKVRVYKTWVRPIITYAVDTQVYRKKTKALLRTAEMRTLSIKGYTLRDRI